jgi:hypothetical protein
MFQERRVATGQRQDCPGAERRQLRTGRSRCLKPPLDTGDANPQRLLRNRLKSASVEELIDTRAADAQQSRGFRHGH